MLPYSIGHEILLLNQRNPLIFDRADFEKLEPAQQRSAVIRAALVCYRTWGQNHRRERNLSLWMWFNRRANWAAEIAEFRNYRTAGTSYPPAPTDDAYMMANGGQKRDGGRSLGGSDLARALGFACDHFKALGCESAYDVPFGLANHLYLTAMEMEGNVVIENEREAEVREELVEHMAKIEEERRCRR